MQMLSTGQVAASNNKTCSELSGGMDVEGSGLVLPNFMELNPS
jgi:hypothetical protein